MKKWLRKLGVAIAVLVALLFAGTLYYFTPRATKVTITGSEVKRMDRKGTKAGQTRDVYFIYAKNVSDGKARAFRNEDNPWYFKWDSGDVAAQAISMAQNQTADLARGGKEVVLAKYYGFRFPFFDLFPNVLSLKAVPADYVYIPVVPIIFLIVLLVVFIWGGIKMRKLFHAASDKARALTGKNKDPESAA